MANVSAAEARTQKKLTEILKEMPLFINIYFDNKKEKMSSKTMLGYAYDIRKFLAWLRENFFQNYASISRFTLDDFSSVTPDDIEFYIYYLRSESDQPNLNVSIRRKISSLSSVYNFYCDGLFLDENPCKGVDYPDIIVKDNTILSDDNIKQLLHSIANDGERSDKQNSYINKTRLRDFTIVSLMLTTGIRVNECSSLNISSVDFKRKTLTVARNSNIYLPLSDVILNILKIYLKERKRVSTTTSALFLSMQNKRMCVQAIEDMIKKYGNEVDINEPVTPKMLRHTFAANLYEISMNSDLVGSYLGKKRVEDLKLLMNHLSDENKTVVYDTVNSMYKDISFSL